MAWNDLTISQRSQLMNIYRQNGVTSLSEMKRLYDLSSPFLVEAERPALNNVAPMYAQGGPKSKGKMIPPQGVDEYSQDFVGPVLPKSAYNGPEVPYGFYDTPIDWERKKALQHYNESSFKANQVSPAGAMGPYQIMPKNWETYSKKLGLTGTAQDYKNSEAVRDKMMEELLQAKWVNKGFPSDSVRAAKALMGYNWGSGNATKFLENMKNKGVDIYHSMDWIDKIPSKETKNYINYILREKDIPGGKTIEAFEKALPHRFDAYPEAKKYDMGGPEGYLWDPINGIIPEETPEYTGGTLEPAMIAAQLPAKFNGSQASARRYAEGYKWGRENVRDPREEIAPYVGTGLAATMAAPVAVDLVATGLANPYIRTALDIAGNVDGAKNLLSNNGIKKTIKLAKSGDTFGAIKSGVGDTLDLLGVADLARFPIRVLNKTNRALHAFDAIQPMGYMDHASRMRTWLKDIITDKPVNIDNPTWYDDYFRDRAASYLPKAKGLENLNNAGKLAGEARFDAWRLYTGLPQKYGTYIPNTDGSYRYNLEKIQKLSPKMSPDTFSLMNYRYSGNTSDLFTSAGGNLEYDNLYNFGVDQTNPNKSYELREIIDKWDLQPFSNMDQKQLSGTINALWQQPIQKLRESITFSRRSNPIMRKIDSALNRLRFKDIDFTKLKTFDKIYDKVASMEAGKIIGGKPFIMHTEIPHTIDLSNPMEDNVLWGFKGDNPPQAVLDYIQGMSLPTIVQKYNIPVVDMAHIDDLEYINDKLYAGGGKIHIKPSHRGKFTALKKRTGKSASWFKAHGTPAQKKMAVFALNARHWGKKKAHGGIIF